MRRALRRSWSGIQFTYVRDEPLPGGGPVLEHWKSESGIVLSRQRAFTAPLAANWEIWVPSGKHTSGFCPEDALMNAGVIARNVE